MFSYRVLTSYQIKVFPCIMILICSPSRILFRKPVLILMVAYNSIEVECVLLSLMYVFVLFWFSITGDVKKLLVHKTGLEPEEQRLFFRGIEKDDKEHLHLAGVKDKSKILLLEGTASKERKLEEARKQNEMLKASEAVAGVRAEVDKLSDRVSMCLKYKYSTYLKKYYQENDHMDYFNFSGDSLGSGYQWG